MPHFIDSDAAKNFECVICLDVFKEPVQIGCNDHIFCKQCIMQTASQKRIYCPLCRVKCKTNSVRRVQFIDRQINQLMVKCPNHTVSSRKVEFLTNKSKSPRKTDKKSPSPQKKDDNDVNENEDEDNDLEAQPKKRKRLSGRKRKRSFGDDEIEDFHHKRFKSVHHELCHWVGSLSELEAHTKACPLQLISCKYCAVSMLQRDLKLHHEECSAFPIQCIHCKQRDISRGCMQTHIKDECVMTPVQCPQKCGQKIRRKQVEYHIKNTCPETMIQCTFHRFGCLDEFKRKNEKKHIKDAVFTHNYLLGKKVVSLTQENERFAVRIRAMEKQERNHKREMKTMRNEMISRMDQMQKKHRSLRKTNHELISRVESIEETCLISKKGRKRLHYRDKLSHKYQLNDDNRCSDSIEWLSADSDSSSDSD